MAAPENGSLLNTIIVTSENTVMIVTPVHPGEDNFAAETQRLRDTFCPTESRALTFLDKHKGNIPHAPRRGLAFVAKWEHCKSRPLSVPMPASFTGWSKN